MTTSRKRGGRPLKGKKKKQKAAARAAAAGPAFGALPSRTKPPTAAPEPAAQDPSVSDVEDERIVSLADIRDQMTAPTAPDSLSEDDSDDASTIRGTNAEMGGSALSDDDDIPFSEDEDHTEDEFDIAAGSVATTSVWGETQLGFEGMTKSELYRSSIQGRFGKDIEELLWNHLRPEKYVREMLHSLEVLAWHCRSGKEFNELLHRATRGKPLKKWKRVRKVCNKLKAKGRTRRAAY